MKRGYLGPVAVLILTASLCLWSGNAVIERADACQEGAAEVEAMARRGDYAAAADALSYALSDWRASRDWLHAAAWHDELDAVETLYARCLVYAEEEEGAELLAALSELRAALEQTAERERIRIGNVL